MNILQLYKSDPTSRWIIYYIVLGLLQCLWTHPAAFPPTPMRVAMIAAMYLPMLFHKQLVLLGMPFSLLLTGQLCTSYTFLPNVSSLTFYISILLVLLLTHSQSLHFKNLGKAYPLLLLAIFFGVADIAFLGGVGKYAEHLIFGLLLLPFLIKEQDYHLLSASLVLSCFIIAFYYIFLFKRFLVAWGSTGFDRSAWNDPNYFSIFLVAGFVVASFYVFKLKQSNLFVFNKTFLSVGMCFTAAAVFLTASRAGFVCLAFSLFTLLLFGKVKWTTLIIALIVITLAVAYMYSLGVFEILLWRFTEQGDADTGGLRTLIWENMFNRYTTQSGFNQFFGGGFRHRLELTNGWDMHNEFLSVFADYGFIGFLLLVFFVVSVTKFTRTFVKDNILVISYLLLTASLSPLLYINIVFFMIWMMGSRWHEKLSLADQRKGI